MSYGLNPTSNVGWVESVTMTLVTTPQQQLEARLGSLYPWVSRMWMSATCYAGLYNINDGQNPNNVSPADDPTQLVYTISPATEWIYPSAYDVVTVELVLNYIYNPAGTPIQGGIVVYGGTTPSNWPQFSLSTTAPGPSQTYAVMYNGNGNTGGTVPIDSNGYLSGATVTVLDNTGNLVNTGYGFAGWNTQPDGSGTTYQAGNTFTMPATNVTLYAVWGAPTLQTITYNANGGSGTMSPTTGYAGSSVRLAANAFTYTGHTFMGWATSPTGLVVYADSETITMPAGGLSLYAVWSVLGQVQCKASQILIDAKSGKPVNFA